jgi:glycosyltransferase involved in cell wall biosynthesis
VNPVRWFASGALSESRRVLEKKMETCVIFATANRPEILAKTLACLESQTVRPATVILSCVNETDAESAARRSNITFITGEMGLTKQRNAGLRNLPDSASIVAFFDDDFVPHPGWIEAVEKTFNSYPDVVVVTGSLIADGINGPGYTFEQAQDFIAGFKAADFGRIEEPFSPYGCNMAFRKSALSDMWFDERLVLYGWQEDRDFGARVAERGRAVKVSGALGVHLGVKRGRVSGVRLGYSQIINPIYLYRKGTMAPIAALTHILRNCLSNLVRSLFPEPYIDRRGRLRGNCIALLDAVRGQILPERAARL